MSWAGLGCQIRTDFSGLFSFFVYLTADFYACFVCLNLVVNLPYSFDRKRQGSGIHVRVWLGKPIYCSIALEALQGWNLPSWGPIISEVLLAESGVQRSDCFSALRRLA